LDLNIIKRASLICDQLVVCVMVNSGNYTPLFTIEERVELIRRVCFVSQFSGLFP
jgi:phosphopantetheine adenylyltransferase